ncbi:hypothetical protein M1558_02760 [Candidatus Parvarchaeota archaeon]|nr:hypothetical protein [Candidatus Parvarchaeota archaeon]
MRLIEPPEKKSYKIHFTTFIVVLSILLIILFFLSTIPGFLNFNLAKLFGLKPITITPPNNISVTPPVNTTNSTKSIPVPKYTLFYESGLPVNSIWSISLPSGVLYSNANYLNYSSFLKNFSFKVNKVFFGGCIFLPTSKSGTITAGSSIYISFSAICNTTFNQYGLPNHINWTITYDNVSRNANTNSTYFISTYGDYPFSVSDSAYNGCPYYPYPQSGYVNAGSSKSIIFFTTCSSKSNKVTFLETGLPSGYNWTVKYDNITTTSNLTQIVFIPVKNASLIPIFNVSIIKKNNCIFTPSPENGNSTAGGNILITFNSSCNTTISEEGLPNSTTWSAEYDNKIERSSSFFLSIDTNYSLSNLSVSSVTIGNCTFNPTINLPNPIIAGSSISVLFSPSCITTFSEKNLPIGINWSVKYGNKALQSTANVIKFNTSNISTVFSVSNSTNGGCVYSPVPSTGNLTAGSSISIYFSQTCHTVFVSNGLPSGVSWSVDYDNQIRDGAFNSSIEFPYYKGKTFSFNVSTIRVGNCTFTPNPENGSILAGSLQRIRFSGECGTEFAETGLPNNTNWNVTFDNITKSSTITSLNFNTINGSYNFSIPSIPISKDCYYIPSPSSGNVVAGSNETVSFTDSCITSFIDPGLPSGANWTVTFAAVTKHSINPNMSFLLPQGKYYYQIPQTSYKGCNYAPNVTSGSTEVGNNIHVTFNLTTCDTVFAEAGLPSGTSWQVVFNGSTLDSQTSSISFSNFPGNYTFSVGKITLGTCVFSPNESVGTVKAGSVVNIGFNSLCYTDFYEKGLPVSSLWQVNYGGKTNSSIGTLISIKTRYSTFPFVISNVSAGGNCYFIPQPISGNNTAGTALTVNYIEKCISTFYEKGLYKNVYWSVTYDGTTVSGNKNNLSILNFPGNYSYEIKNTAGRGCLFDSLNSSGNLISGSNTTIQFSPVSCISNITETGLPVNTNWSISINNITNFSVKNYTSVVTKPGNYSLYITPIKINGCVFSASYSSEIMAGSSFTVHFTAACRTIFTETGLPNGIKWEVNYSYPSYFDYNLPIPQAIYAYTLYSSYSNKIIVNSSNSSANPYNVKSIPISSSCSYKPQPSSGYITPGDNLSIVFENDCVTYFKETGLPSNTQWKVYFDGINASSDSNQILFLTQIGVYNFKIFTAESNGCFYVSNVTQGTINTSSVLNVNFIGKFCLTTFKETGLPSNTQWNVTFNNLLESSSSSEITFNNSFSTNTYNYYIRPNSISEQGCHINISSGNGTATVGSSVLITYTNACKTLFNETGLPSNTKWDVTFDGVSSSSYNDTIVIYASPGNHSYVSSVVPINSGCFYYPKPRSAYLVSGKSSKISYTKECISTFLENGLPSGALWTVVYNGSTNSSRISNISFVTLPGNFSFSVKTVDYSYCSFLPSPSSGYLTAGGNKNISFVENNCNTTFIETGLPDGVQWKLTFDGITESPSTNNITITTPAGIFAAKFYSINMSNCIFEPQPSSSSTAAGAFFYVHFTAKCITKFTETGLPNGEYWFVTYNGTTVSSNSTVIKVPSINGSYSYTLPFIGNSSCSYRPNPSSGIAVAGSSLTINYSGGCTTTFYENGLPPGSEWNLTYDNENFSSTTTSIQLVTQPGIYRFAVPNLTIDNCLYVAENGSSNLAAGSTAYLVFNQTKCYTTFTVSNLPKDSKWTFTYNGVNYSSDNTSLQISTVPGTFNFTAYNVKEYNCVFTPNPSSGHIAAGSSLLLSFSSSCATLFNETGLSKGITWSVKFDGITNYSSNTSLDVDSIYGNFSFSVPRIQVSANCYLTPNMSSGYLVAGSTTKIGFSTNCSSEFIETGLPSGVSWSVDYDNITNSSVSSEIGFNIIKGNYSFSIPTSEYDNCYFVSNESKGYSEAGSYNYVKFTERYCISNFTEAGLPSGTGWNVTFDNKFNTSTSTHISFNNSKGLYNFTIPVIIVSGCAYIPTPSGGEIAAGSSIKINFSVSYCVTTFTETGLPLNYNWSVTYDGMRNFSTGKNVTFNDSVLSSFSFSVQVKNESQCSFIPSPESGNVVSGSTISITFNSICHTYFNEVNLPSGYVWEVNLAGHNQSSKSNTIEFTTSYNKNYSFEIYPSVHYNYGFTPNISSSYIEVGSNFTVKFSNDTFAYRKPVIIPISIYNNQSIETPSPFQQMLSINSSRYSKYENSGLTNIMFTYKNGTVIPSWVESGNSNTSSDTIYWLRIGGIAGKSGITIDMIFNQTLITYSNNFNNRTTGEAPQLSPIYGEYDDIGNVMNKGLEYQIYFDSSGTCDSGSYQNNVYAAALNNGVTISSCAAMSSSTPPFYTPVLGSSQDVDGTTESNVVINYQEGYSGGSAYPNPPVSNTANSWIIKAIGWAEVNSSTSFSVGSDDGIALGYSTSAYGGNGEYWLGGTSNPNNLVSEWHTEGFTAYSGTISNIGTQRIELDYFEDGGGAYTALWSNNPIDYYSPSAPPNGVMPTNLINSTLAITRFEEQGLPLNYNWSVIYDNIDEYSITPEINFTTVVGNYSYLVPTLHNSSSTLDCVTTYSPFPSSGYLLVGNTQIIVFSNSTACQTTISEKGIYNFSKVEITYKRNTSEIKQVFLVYIHNAQDVATPSPFQQMINLSYPSYEQYINLTQGHEFQNVEFLNLTSGKVIDSWLENYTSKYAIFWIKLPNGIPANSTIKDIAIYFAPKYTNLFNNQTTGETPQLSPTYGEYDNGADIFNYYQRFGGLSALPSGWSNLGGVPVSFSQDYMGYTQTSWGNYFYGLYSMLPSSIVKTPLTFLTYVYSYSVSKYQINYAGITYEAPATTPETPTSSNEYYVSDVSLQNGINNVILTVSGNSAEYISYLTYVPSGLTGSYANIYWNAIAAYPPNGVMPTVNVTSLPALTLYPSSGNLSIKANTSLACNPQTRNVEAGSTYVFSNWNCTTTFNQSTLPKGSNWWVDYDGINKSNSTGNRIKMNFNSSGLGIYSYSAGSSVNCSSNGTAAVGISDNISTWFCVTEFEEQGLPLNYNWSVIYDNIDEYSITPEINFTVLRGNYSYLVPTLHNSSSTSNCVTTYSPSPSSGYLSAGNIKNIIFSNSTLCNTSFAETGLYYNSSALSITYDGITKSVYPAPHIALVSIYNNQNSATPASFQQMVNFSYSAYRKYINLAAGHEFQNVEFFNTTNGSVIDSWLESYNSKYAIFWIKLPNGIPANTNLTDIAIGFVSNTTSLFNNKTTGEAPQLSPTYAEYDDGANVFNYYENFAGSGLPSGWQELTSSGDTYTWDNGISFTNNGHNNYVSIGTTSAVSSAGILELGITSGSNARPTIELARSDTQIDGGQPIYMYEDGYGQSYGMYSGDMQFEILTTSYSDIANSKTAYNAPIIEGIAWTATGSQLLEIVPNYNYNNMETVSESSTSNSLSTPLYIMLGQAASGSSSDTGGYTANWLRVRSYPPNGVMPSVIISNYSFTKSISTFSTPPGNFTVKANTSLDCTPKIKTVEAGYIYFLSNWNCTTTFNQSTLPKGSNWWVDYDGINKSNKTGSEIKMNFNSSGLGIYSYSAGSSVNCSSNGTAEVGTSDNLSNWLCVKEFVEEGLPTSTNWTVKYGNKINYSSSNLIKIASSFGNYSYSINNVTISNTTYIPNSSFGYTFSFGKLVINFSKLGPLPKSIYKYIKLKIINSQKSTTSQPFQQMINMTINSSNSKYINKTGHYAFQNVEFFNTTNGKVIDSWLESYNSKYAIFWIKLPNGIPANTNLTDIAIGFASNTTNLFNNNTTGEAPQLSSTYAEYDNGANVFTNYWNFAGTSLASGINSITSNGSVSVNNGVTIKGGTTSEGGENGIYTSSSFTAPIIVDYYGTQTTSFQGDVWGWSEPGFSNYTGSSDASPNIAGTYTLIDFEGSPGGVNVSSQASPSNSQGGTKNQGTLPNENSEYPASVWTQIYTNTTYYTYQNYVNNTGYITGASNNASLPFEIEVGNNEASYAPNGMTVYWLRTRAYPPNGVMPTVEFNASVS